MTETIRTIDLTSNTASSVRDVVVDVAISSIDINQTDGTYSSVEPYNADGSYNGRVVIYPQSPVSQIATSTELKTFNRVGSLSYPLDAKFDYLRRKIWIADTGNNRVLKVNLNTNQVDLTIDDNLIYPHALAVDVNTGNIFIKGYQTNDLTHGTIYYYKKDGTLLYTFNFNRNDTDLSSSSSSGDVSSSSLSQGSSVSSSSSSEGLIPDLPSSASMFFDYVRSRLWWVDDVKIYMADIRNQQVQVYDIRSDGYTEALRINVELATGNAFVIVDNIHNDRFLIQMSRDNNNLLGSAYIVRS